MFEIGWTEMLVIAVVMIVVVGPKDLPKMLRTFGKMTAKMRGMAGDFQRQFNEALKEAELDDVKKSVDALKGLNPTAEIRKQLNPFEKAAADVRSGLDNAMKPKPAATEAQPAEPLKAGATGLPSEGPPPPPEPPMFPAMSDPLPPGAAAAASAAPVKAESASVAPPETAAGPAKPASPKSTKAGAPKSAAKPSSPGKAKPAAKAAAAVAVKAAPKPPRKANALPATAKAPAEKTSKTAPASAKKKPAGSVA